MPLEIDRDVESIPAGELGDGLVIQRADIVEDVDRPPDPLLHLVMLCRAVGISMDLEAVPVVQLEQPRHQVHGRMVVEVGREIADPQLAGPRRWPRDRLGDDVAQILGGIEFGTHPVPLGRIFEGEHRERRDAVAGDTEPGDRGRLGGDRVPVADMCLLVQLLGAQRIIVGFQAERGLEAGDRLILVMELLQDVAQIDMGVDMIGLRPQRVPEAGAGLLLALERA